MITETELRGRIVKEVTETSQADVARRLKISRAYISDIVAGKRRISKSVAEHYGYRPLPISVPVERQYAPLRESENNA